MLNYSMHGVHQVSVQICASQMDDESYILFISWASGHLKLYQS